MPDTTLPKWLSDLRVVQAEDTLDYTNYYNGYALFNKLSLENIIPEIFIIAGNRTGGKTFFVKRLLTRLFIRAGHTFLWVTRKITQVDGAIHSFYEDISECDDIPGEWKIEKYVRGVKALTYNDEIIGYFTFLNFSADLKEVSNMFNSVGAIIKDEFQEENNDYQQGEIQKLRSIHKSVSRGFGKSTRYCPLILMGNQLSIINPYYVAFGIHKRLRSDTHYLRGKGWVLEVFFNEHASEMSEKSAFELAFGNDRYSQSSNHNVFLDNTTFIEKRDTSKMRPQFSIGVCKQWYSLWNNGEIMYLSHQPISKRIKLAIDVDSHVDGTILVRAGDPLIRTIKQYYDNGRFRFEDIECKNACASLMCYAIVV